MMPRIIVQAAPELSMQQKKSMSRKARELFR
jgi:hypothetical protein